MEIIEILGYFGALIVGLTLGLIGGGGSILAVPILAYLFLIDAKTATAYSLFIVGSSALVGAVKQHFKEIYTDLIKSTDEHFTRLSNAIKK